MSPSPPQSSRHTWCVARTWSMSVWRHLSGCLRGRLLLCVVSWLSWQWSQEYWGENKNEQESGEGPSVQTSPGFLDCAQLCYQLPLERQLPPLLRTILMSPNIQGRLPYRQGSFKFLIVKHAFKPFQGVSRWQVIGCLPAVLDRFNSMPMDTGVPAVSLNFQASVFGKDKKLLHNKIPPAPLSTFSLKSF